ncbi:hypothetical protein COUCH_26235 [Couchioplanes caeruleus]|uniref:hypothetical protein n=1 Tax=Couchioplanes caeruleus TaxID=56438 RepID=UPI0020C07AF6|nr:hypothetical protein [Couchioplanes caeruleus]UQU62519.1 hypothetical protein COUCH_26235 [Couchioplanes caeruleus]
MSAERLWWAQRAQQLRYTQLDVARRQAETWRTGLTGLTGLLGAVLIVKGRDNASSLADPYPWLVLALFLLGAAALVVATLSAIRAASGVPGDECLLTGEDLQRWTEREVAGVYRAVTRARHLTVGGVCAVALGVAVAWSAPMAGPDRPVVRVSWGSDQGTDQICGRLLAADATSLRVGGRDQYHIVPLTSVVRVEVVARCSG